MKNVGGFCSKIIRFLPAVLLAIGIFLFRKKLSGVFFTVFAAVLMAYMLDPLVDFLQKHLDFAKNKARNRAVMVVFVSSLVVIGLTVAFVAPIVVSNVTDIVENTDQIIPKITSYVENHISDEHIGMKTKVLEITNSAMEKISLKADELSESATSFSLLGKISGVLVGFITAIVLAYYFLRDKKIILNGILGIFPYEWREQITDFFDELAMISSKFIQGQVFVAIIVGSLEMLGLFLLGIPYSVFYGIIGGLSNMIPYFGPFIGAVLPVITALLISPVRALWVLALFLVVQQIDNHFISPKIIEGNLGIHPATVIIVIFIGQELFGIWGLITAIPVYAVIKCTVIRIFKLVYLKNTQRIESKI